MMKAGYIHSLYRSYRLKYLVLTFLLCYSTQISAQSYQYLQTISTEAKYFTTDKLQNLYVVTPENDLIKYSPQGVELFRFNFLNHGDISHIDATNPLQILVFNQDYLQLTTLDRTLSETGTLNLLEFGIAQTKALGLGNTNDIWLYDELNQELKNFNAQGDLIRTSNNTQFFLNEVIQPNFLLTRNNKVYLNDPNLGIIIFDIYGQYDKTLPIKNLAKFQIVNNQLIYQKELRLFAYPLNTFQEKQLPLPFEILEKDDIHLSGNRLYKRAEGTIKIYTIEE